MLRALVLWQGSGILAAVSLAWCWAASRRLRVASRGAALPSGPLPGVCVVLPITGASAHKLQSVRSQLRTAYPGAVHFLFAVESPADPAFAVATRLCAELERSSKRSAEVIIAGLATDRSQKIHNQRAAVATAAPHWPLFLFTDDDCWYHPGTIDGLVTALLAEPGALMATGYPFDVPAPRATFASLCVMAYHLPLLVAFSQGTHARHVWGGCMLLPSRHCRPGGCVAGAWGEGAYSDDLNLAAVASALGKPILCPAAAVFPIALDGDCTPGQAWNYLRRQQFVLDTYMDAHNRRINHSLWACTVYAAASIVAAACDVVLTLGLSCARGTPLPWHTLVFVLLLCGMQLALRRLYGSLYRLCKRLSPEWVPPSGVGAIPWGRVVWALCVTQAALLACAARMLVSGRIVWASTEYVRRRGLVRPCRGRELRGGGAAPLTGWAAPYSGSGAEQRRQTQGDVCADPTE